MLRFILIACLVWLLLALIQKLRRVEWSGQGQRQQAVTKKMMFSVPIVVFMCQRTMPCVIIMIISVVATIWK